MLSISAETTYLPKNEYFATFGFYYYYIILIDEMIVIVTFWTLLAPIASIKIRLRIWVPMSRIFNSDVLTVIIPVLEFIFKNGNSF